MSYPYPESIDWSQYAIDGPAVGRPLHEVSRKIAEEYFADWMAARDRRAKALRALTESNGVDMDDLTALNDWYFGNVTENPDQPGRMASRWYAVAMDIAMYLGDRLISEAESDLRWEMVTKPKNDMSYQRPVIRGFNVPYPLYNWDPELGITTTSHRVIGNKKLANDSFEYTLEYWVGKAEFGRTEQP